ncbi:MAG: acyl-CoA dehydrogenase family protein [Acidimicrobiia bacterium]
MDGVLRRSVERLAPIGRMLYDTRSLDLWERDTATLPRFLRRRRRAYRTFAQHTLAPLALNADAEPDRVDLRSLLAEAGRLGFQSEQLPPPFGTMPVQGMLRWSLFQTALKAEEFTAACAGLGLALLAHDLGSAPLYLSGDIRAARRWLAPMCRANRAGNPRLAAFAITEPAAGSDAEDTVGARAARPGTTARRANGGYVLNGQKVFISGGRHADLVTVFAALDPGDGDELRMDRHWTCFVAERGASGFRTGRSEHKLGQRASDATELFFDDVFVPSENRVGPEYAGWALNRNVLNYSRVPVGAIALGIARAAVEAAVDHARHTRLGNRPLLHHQEVQLTLADMWLDVSAMRGMVWQAARHMPPNQGVSSAVKAFCGDRAFAVAGRAMDLLGDAGALSTNRVEKAMRDARLNQIYEGTNQINRLAVIEAFADADFAGSLPS